MTLSFRIRHGLDIPVAGAPDAVITEGPPVRRLALCGPDYPGLKPRMLVDVGDEVSLGQPLFIDKRDPAAPFTSPGTGRVVAVNRGERRRLESVVVEEEGQAGAGESDFESLLPEAIDSLAPDAVAERLCRAGLWTAFRTRPFSCVPHSDSRPRALFVTAIDTRPLAADPRIVIKDGREAFEAGLRVLARLKPRRLYLCTAPGWPFEFSPLEGLRRAEFSGPHPAGLPGTHIHLLDPVGADRVAWHIAYPDVIAIGRLFTEGRIAPERIVALGGEGLKQPRLVRTRQGASLTELLEGSCTEPAECRVVSGSVLCGRTAERGLAFLGRYHNQVSVIPEGGNRHLFGWTGLFPRRYTAAPTLLRQTGHRRKAAFTTAQNGRYSGMIPMRAFDRVVPLDILPSPLFRALMVRDTDQAQALGCLELDEEDLALCEFLCPAKNDYGTALRINLDQIERGG
ncbi:MAG: Na(+)-translocating NADH-quinone reductase subunit A [Xanthomonadales bacterium]|nr:Na(+)-translocating NADH-quinone reductase subunit A [Xanthomonadales bacterium]